MAVRVLPVEVPPAEPPVDLHVGLAERGAPVRDPSRLDAAEDRVELGVVHLEAVVMTLELFSLREVVDVDGREGVARRPARRARGAPLTEWWAGLAPPPGLGYDSPAIE